MSRSHLATRHASSFTDALLGDLAEERALRAVEQGAVLARWWYLRQLLRAAPFFLRDAVLHGDRDTRANLVAAAVGLLGISALGISVLVARPGSPARIVAGRTDHSPQLVVNEVSAIQLPVRVLDARGRRLRDVGVRFTVDAAAPIDVSPVGVATCKRRGDAVVHASLGTLHTAVPVHCRPVYAVRAASWISMVAGGPPQDAPFEALASDGTRVLELRGAVRIRDTTIATIVAATLFPRAAGETRLSVTVGNRAATMRVLVHEPVRSFTTLRDDQRLVAVPVRLAQGDTVSIALPGGELWVKYMPRRSGNAPPTISARDFVSCDATNGLQVYLVPADEQVTHCVTPATGAHIVLAHGAVGAPVVEGWLAIERLAAPPSRLR